MSKSTLSSVVSSLVRASVGTSVPTTIPDEDLDKHVAELILKEAKQKAESYSKLGLKAYLPTGPDPNAPRPNKRFLSSIIRSTDDHNKTILRAQALAAQEIKKEREEQERKERRARAEEAAAAERSRRRRRQDDYDSDEWDTRKARERSRPRSRIWESDWRTEDGAREDRSERRRGHRRSRRRHRSRSASQDHESEDRRYTGDRKRTPSGERDRHRDSRRSERSRRKHSRRETGDDERSHKRRRRTSRSPHPEQNHNARHKRSRSASLAEEQGTEKKELVAPRNISTPSRSSQTPVEDDAMDMDSESRRASKGKERKVSPVISPPRVPSSSPNPAPPPPPRRARGRPMSSTSVRSPSVSPPPLPPAALPSKMDKYFEDSYDPRLDVTALSIPTVPQTGLVNDSEYEAWDAMLELLRQRREDKEEKKKLERLGFDSSDKKIPTSKLKNYSEGGDSIMEIEYKKKGSVREWDLGKEGF